MQSSTPELVSISVLSKGSLHDQERKTGGDLELSEFRNWTASIYYHWWDKGRFSR